MSALLTCLCNRFTLSCPRRMPLRTLAARMVWRVCTTVVASVVIRLGDQLHVAVSADMIGRILTTKIALLETRKRLVVLLAVPRALHRTIKFMVV